MSVHALTAPQRAAVAGTRPETPNQLHAWVRLVLGVDVPREALMDASDAPFDYLAHAFFEDRGDTRADCLVWACRSGGKTLLAACATVLDLVFKPGVQVRVLAGSLEQARRMHAHLRAFFRAPHLAPLVEGKVTERRLALVNGSACEIMAQSHTSVRGAHPHILRCDEVELFDREVWEAAQLLPRSETLGGVRVTGRVEALSTMHHPRGLMSELTGERAGRRLFRWGVVDTLARCEPQRPCEPCPLRDECAGRAKRARGHLSIDDAVRLKSRVSLATWEAEMLCLRPSRADAVFPEFDRGVHVAASDPPAGGRWIGGMDFGFRAPTVVLWAHADDEGVVRVVGERVAREATLDRHIEAVRAAPWPVPAWFGVDPAGRQRSDQTGLSPVAVLRRAGLGVRDTRAPLQSGLSLIRARLAPASGAPTLYIHPRCRELIASLEGYRYADAAGAETPRKDGADHAVDALRYMLVSLASSRPARVEQYW